MSVFFKPHTWLLAALPRLKFAKGDVSAAARFEEFKRLAAEPPSDDPKEREEYEALRSRWLASREAGC